MTAVIETPTTTEMANIAVGELHPSKANPRDDLGDVGELAASIAGVGLIEPLVVTPASRGGGYTVVAGHRRLAAAIEAGLETAPCIIRAGLDKAAQAELRLVENLHRRDLSPLEEARALADLVKLGVSQRDLAKKIGRSQPHISRRLGLLLLPKPAQEALDTGRITLEQATALARMHDDPDRIAEVLDKGSRSSGQIDSWIRYELENYTNAKKRAEVVAELERKGVKMRAFIRGCDELNFGLIGVSVDEEAHAKEPCHIVSVGDNGRLTLQCSDRDRHAPGGKSKLKATNMAADGGLKEGRQERINREATEAAGNSGGRPLGELRQERRADPEWERQQAEEAARGEARTAAIAVRRAFVGSLVRAADAGDAVEMVNLVFLDGGYLEDPYDSSFVLELLGVEPDTFGQRRPIDQVRTFAAKGSRNRARALAAAAAATIESDINPPAWQLRSEHFSLSDDWIPVGRAWLAFLVERGYSLSDLDRELIPEPEPPAEPPPDDAVAWYDDPEEGPRWVDEAEATAIADIDAGRLQYLHTSGAPDQALPGDEPVGEVNNSAQELPTITVRKSGKRWKVTCSACGEVGHNTTEEYGNEAGALHLAGHGSVVEVSA